MPKEVFEFSCPCCGKRVELNVRNGKVRAVDFEDDERGKSLDDLVSDQKHEGKRLGDAFDEAAGDVATQKDRFDDLFSEAKDAAKKEKGTKPKHPFLED